MPCSFTFVYLLITKQSFLLFQYTFFIRQKIWQNQLTIFKFRVKSYWFIRKSSELLTLISIFLLGCLLQCFVFAFFTHPELNKMYRYCICCLYCVYRFVSPNHDSFDIFKIILNDIFFYTCIKYCY